jgi:hypothetical protein
MDDLKKLVSALSKLDRDMFWSEEAEALIDSYTEKEVKKALAKEFRFLGNEIFKLQQKDHDNPAYDIILINLNGMIKTLKEGKEDPNKAIPTPDEFIYEPPKNLSEEDDE